MKPDEKIRARRTIRGKDLQIRYTCDSGKEALLNQRQFYDAQGQILSPITPKFLERQIVGNHNPTAHLAGIEARIVKICFGSEVNTSGESNFVLIVPYAPGDINHQEHIKEIFAFTSSSPTLNPSVPLKVNYQGENLT